MSSALFFVSTEHATHRVADKARFTVNVGNSIFIDKAVRIVPFSISLPHVFPNVNSYRNFWIEVGGSSFAEYEIPVGQYTLTELIAALNATATDITWAVAVDGRVTLQSAGGLDQIFEIAAYEDWFEMLGFTQAVGDVLIVDGTNLMTADSLPYMGGEQIVFISCDKLAPANMIHAKDGTPYDIVASASLHDTEYGQVYHNRSDDTKLGDIEYQSHNQFDTMIIELFDSRMRLLAFPSNQHLHMTFKVYHMDNRLGIHYNKRKR